jgi:hypothetical protein
MGEWRYSSTILDLGITLSGLTLEETVPGTEWIRGWVGPIAHMDVMEKRKNLSLPGI